MDSKRINDPDGGRSWFRSDRLVRESDKWFFLTREGTVEGPFDTKSEARERLEVYTRIMSTQLIEDTVDCKLA